MSITGRRAHVTSQHLERRRLSSSIDSEKTKALTLVNADRDLVDRQMPLSRRSFSVQLFTHRKAASQ